MFNVSPWVNDIEDKTLNSYFVAKNIQEDKYLESPTAN